MADVTVADHIFSAKTWAVLGSTTLVDPAQLIVYAESADGDIYYNTTTNLLDASPEGLWDAEKSMGTVLGTGSNLNPVDEYQLNSFVFNDVVYVTGHRFGGSDNGVYTNSTEDGTSSGTTKALGLTITTDTWARQDVPDFTASSTETGIPRAVTSLVLHDRVFYGNVVSQNTYDYGQRIYWSDAGTANSFTYTGGAFGYVTIGGDDGTTIRKLLGLAGEILVFKEESVWTLTGTDEDTFAVHLLTDAYGLHAAGACGVYRNTAYFFDPYAGVMSYDGAEFDCISEPINDHIFENINRSAAFKSVMYVDHDEQRLYLSVPQGDVASTPSDWNTATYVYDFDQRVWTVWSYGFSSAVKIDATVSASDPVAADGPTWMVGVDGTTVGICQMNNGLQDISTAIAAEFRTAWFNPGDVGDRHRLRRLDVLSGDVDGGDGSLTYYLYRDFNPDYIWVTHTAANDETGVVEWHEQEQENKGTDPVNQATETGLFTWLQLRFYQSSTTDEFQVNGVSLSTSTRPFRRRVLGELNQVESVGCE